MKLVEDTGRTGNFPKGKLGSDDKENLRLTVGIGRGTIIIDFDKPVKRIEVSADDAEMVANLLLKKIKILRNKT